MLTATKQDNAVEANKGTIVVSVDLSIEATLIVDERA